MARIKFDILYIEATSFLTVDGLEKVKPLMGLLADNPGYHGRLTLDDNGKIDIMYDLHDLRELIFRDTDV